MSLTEEVFDQCLVDGSGGHIAKDNNWGSNLAETEVLHSCREGVVGVESS